METQTTVPREQRTLPYFLDQIKEHLFQIFVHYKPTADRDFFEKNICAPAMFENRGGDNMVVFLNKRNDGKINLIHMIIISCAYCAQAADANEKGLLAWTYLMDAQYYRSMAVVAMDHQPNVEHMRQEKAREALTVNAQNSVSVRVDPWQKTKDEAMRLIRELANSGEHWRNSKQAARVIAEQVQKFLETQSPKKRFQSAEQRDTTIAKWLKKMPEASLLFSRTSV